MDMPALLVMTAGLLMQSSETTATDTWQITTKTSSSDYYAGTSNDILMRIRGDKGETRNLRISTGLEKGKTQIFKFDIVNDVGNVQKLRVELTGDDGWFFESINIKNTRTQYQYLFNYNSWIDGDDPHYPNTVTLRNEWQQPQQTHIAAGDTPDKIIVVWSTFNDTADSTVIYGTDGKLDQKAVGSSSRFTDQGPEKRFQFIHKVVLKGLSPKTNYNYRVGSSLSGYSATFSTKSWPSGVEWSPSLAVYGDLGLVNAQSLTRLHAEASTGMYDAILHVGDIAYDMVDDNSRVGDRFMRKIEPLASKVPYMVCPGNHEWQHNFSNYRYRFNMPGDENKQMYYSFNMGPVHFVSIATELWFFMQNGLVPIVEQHKWLERDLAEANKPENRKNQPWIVVFGHRPPYCSNDNNDDCTHHESIVRVGIPILHVLGIEALLYKYGVDLGIWAHEHSYERLWPVYDRKVYNGSHQQPYTNPGAPVHIVTGSAGNKERHDNFDHKVDDWSAFRTVDYGYNRMKVFNSTHLYVEYVSDDKGGEIIDRFMIIKDKHGPYNTPGADPNPKPVADPIKKLWNKFKHLLEDVGK